MMAVRTRVPNITVPHPFSYAAIKLPLCPVRGTVLLMEFPLKYHTPHAVAKTNRYDECLQSEQTGRYIHIVVPRTRLPPTLLPLRASKHRTARHDNLQKEKTNTVSLPALSVVDAQPLARHELVDGVDGKATLSPWSTGGRGGADLRQHQPLVAGF